MELWPYRDKLGFRSICTGDVFLDEVRVPAENLVGEEGGGYAVAMSSVEYGRLAVAARSVGQAHTALADSIQYATERVVFGTPISEFQLTKGKFAEMAEGVVTAGTAAEQRVARIYRDAKVFQLVEGANEIHRVLIADYLLSHRS